MAEWQLGSIPDLATMIRFATRQPASSESEERLGTFPQRPIPFSGRVDRGYRGESGGGDKHYFPPQALRTSAPYGGRPNVIILLSKGRRCGWASTPRINAVLARMFDCCDKFEDQPYAVTKDEIVTHLAASVVVRGEMIFTAVKSLEPRLSTCQDRDISSTGYSRCAGPTLAKGGDSEHQERSETKVPCF
jgi:hypothetical protein